VGSLTRPQPARDDNRGASQWRVCEKAEGRSRAVSRSTKPGKCGGFGVVSEHRRTARQNELPPVPGGNHGDGNQTKCPASTLRERFPAERLPAVSPQV
jgi:hypothetical protein